jgi:acyl-CoA oxidase
LGFYANHAIIFAQLIIKNKKYGIHAFLVPIRDKNYHPFPGVEIGDIGPKYGYNCKDNGYLKLTNYHIPRRHMFMKFTNVSNNGEY